MSFPLCRPFTGEAEALALARVLASGQLVQGEHVRAFEAGLSALLRGQEVAAVSSGTAALHLALSMVGVGPGCEVVVPALTFPAPANVAALLGARVVPVDVDADTCNLDVARLAEAVGPATRAVVVVHQFGVPADVAAVRRVVGPGVAIVEDAACALGASVAGEPCGTLGDVACFSFHPRKVVTTGEGGAVTSPDPAVVARARTLRNHGMGAALAGAELPAGRFVEPGWNLRMSDLHAAIGVVQLDRLAAIIEARRALAETYRDALGDSVRMLPGLLRKGAVAQSLVVELPGTIDRGAFLEALGREGVEATVASYALHRLPALRAHCGGDERYPVATRLHEQGVTLPLFPALEREAVAEVARVVEALVRRST